MSRSHREADGAVRRKIGGVAPGPHPYRPPPRAPLRRRKAQHLSRRWTFPPFCTTMIFAREDIPPPRTHAPVAQLDRVSDSDSEGHRFDSCRVYHRRRKASFAAPRKNLWGACVCACGSAPQSVLALMPPNSFSGNSSLRYFAGTPFCSSRRKNTDVRPAPRFSTAFRNYRVAL